MSMIVCCSSQVLPDHFEDIAHAKAFCDVEKAARSKGSMLQGVALDVPSGSEPSPVSNDDIPDSVLESFYRGLVFVSVKDAVFQPSSPLRA